MGAFDLSIYFFGVSYATGQNAFVKRMDIRYFKLIVILVIQLYYCLTLFFIIIVMNKE